MAVVEVGMLSYKLPNEVYRVKLKIKKLLLIRISLVLSSVVVGRTTARSLMRQSKQTIRISERT